MPLNYRRRLLQALLLGSALPARAQAAYPNRSIKLVVPLQPGGGVEVLIRQFLPRLSAVLGQTVYLENRVGAGGIVAAEYVSQQPADGYTLLFGASTQLALKLLQPRAGFDPVTGFTHVTRLSYSPSLLIVGPAAPYRALDDLLRAARAAPGRLNYGSGGNGTPSHLAAAALAHHGGVDVSHIPYRGAGDLLTALAAGDVQFAVLTASTALPLVQGGRLRALAVTSAQREPFLPALPTLKELTGNDDLVLVPWSGLWLPAGAPPAVVRTLFDAHARIYGDPEVANANAGLGITIALSASPAEFSAFVAAESAKMARIVKAAKIEPN